MYIPYGRQHIIQNDIDAVVSVLRSDFLTQGPCVPLFEKEIANYCGAKYGVAVNSATSALHIACLALGLGSGDSLWTSAITFAASANCALYCGANVDFVDIDPLTYNLCTKSLKEKLIVAAQQGCLPKVLVPVHMSGQPCDMVEIDRLAKQYGFKVIEDASHAIGAKYQNNTVGSCLYSDITIFSFHPVKIITTGEGGMAVTNNAALAKKMGLLRSHGITRDVVDMHNPSAGPWHYEQIALGFNYRMTEIQAALGISQMKRLNQYVQRRHELASRYDRLLKELPLRLPKQNPDSYSAYHLYVIRLDVEKIRSSHRTVFDNLRAENIGVNLHYIPVYLHPYYQQLGFTAGLCPQAEQYAAEAISLPLYPELSEKEQDFVIKTLQQVLI